MPFFVYMIVTKSNNRYISYVGYTKNLKKRLSLHNTSKGAKFTKGNVWKLIYKKRYPTKSIAMQNEYMLKKNRKLRNQIKINFIKKNENINTLTL